MKREPKYVNFYNLALLKGCSTGMESTQQRTLALNGTAGSYITPMFDTGDTGGDFGRLIVEGSFADAKLEVIVAATDETDAVIDGAVQGLKDWLGSSHIPPAQKADALVHLPSHVRAVNTQDILLHDLRGRYVWIYLAVYPATVDCECALVGLRLELPKVSFSAYFPEIYQGHDFFERFIAVFQSLLLDVERQVDDVPRLLDYHTTPDRHVEYLAGWLGIQNERRLFTPEQLRRIIADIDLFQGAKGTKRALEAVILLVTGIRPRIIEHFQWQSPRFSPASRAIYRLLYGETANHFCVILDLTNAQLNISERNLEQLIESYCMLGAAFKVVYLRRCSHTDTHCYLDVNGALSVPEIASIDGGAFGGHMTIG